MSSLQYKLGRVVSREIGTWCDPDDLAANRDGRLTSSQRRLLLARPTHTAAISLGVLALVPLGLALSDLGIVGFAGYMRAAWPFSSGWSWRPIVGIAGLVLLAASAWSWRRATLRRPRFRSLVL